MVNKQRVFRVLLVEDEYQARKGLKDILRQKHRDFEVAGEAKTTEEARKLLEQGGIDGVFLDIHIATEYGRAGLDLAYEINRLPKRPWIIIYTAYVREHAEEIAGRIRAAGLLGKPLINAEVDETLGYIRKEYGSVAVAPPPRRVSIRHQIKNRFDEQEWVTEFVDPENEICFVRTDRGGETLHVRLADGRILTKVAGPLSKREDELGGYGFLRIHQSILVNLKMVLSMKKGEPPEVVLRHCSDEKPLEVGPNYRRSLENALNELTKR